MLIFECRSNLFILNMTDDFVFFGQKPFFLLKSRIYDGIYTKVILLFSFENHAVMMGDSFGRVGTVKTRREVK